MDDLINSLNDSQKEAVAHINGPVLIVAGAGAGKTKTITHRIGYLIKQGVKPEEILAITFTNKAAKEMGERVFNMLGRQTGSFVYNRVGVPWISTFHSLGIAILREFGPRIGISKSATIIDQDDAKKLVKDAIKKQGLDPKMYDPGKLLNIISRHKGNLGDASTISSTTRDEYKGKIYERTMTLYEKLLKESNALDFDDLLEKTVKLLRENIDVKDYYNNKWKYIHVDEYQDTNSVQYELTKLLTGKEKNICVVGDHDQMIYSWRGSSLANILDFENDYPEAKIILLEKNYRSTKIILEAANDVISKNELRKEKVLFTDNEEGEKITIIEGFDEGDEARKIAEKIGSLLTNGIKERDIAILYRTNTQSRVLEEAMLYSGINYQVLGTRFYDRKEVKDILAYLRAAISENNKIDFARIINVPTRGIGEKTLEKILSGDISSLTSAMQSKYASFKNTLSKIKSASELQQPSELIKTTIEESGVLSIYKDGDEEDLERIGNMYELVSIAKRYDGIDNGLDLFLQDVALEGDQDRMKSENSVRLMTVHASKGLEFDYVFISGMEQDLFPSNRMRDNDSQEAQEEERRLFYVAITRAAKKVFLSHAASRMIFGSRNYTTQSEFIDDINPRLIEQSNKKHSVPKRKISLLDDPFEEDSLSW